MAIDYIAGALRRLLTAYRVLRYRKILSVGTDVHIGLGCYFRATRGITIGDHSYLGKQLMIETNAQIGKFALFGNRVAFVGRHDHEYTRVGIPMRFGRWVGGHDADPIVAGEGVVVEDDVWIGYGATVLSGTRIGRGSIIGVGAVVSRDVEPYDIVAGVPARSVGKRFHSAAEIAAHEKKIASGHFRSSERGYRYWTVQPGDGS